MPHRIVYAKGQSAYEWIESHTAVFVVLGMLILAYVAVGLYEQQQEIQQQHVDNTRGSCETQNSRNHATTAQLDRELKAAAKKRGTQAKQLAAFRTSTVLLIDALDPLENCEARVLKVTHRHLRLTGPNAD